ncbi:sugar ABC transporter substrate-binding protein [Brachybacterium hainanense]|uniref:Extracellular solute-binding protein n=1 Tax=Brachybacterium hainanense TaxID=1541174 RepID=A0ABV6RE38_9MICO
MQIRRKSFLALGAAGAATALLAACGGESSPDTAATEPAPASDGGGEADPSAAPARADADLVIWADEKKAASLQEPIAAWAQTQGITAAVQTISNDPQAAFVTANQAGNGPDVMLGAHDWIGNLVQNAAIVPVQLPSDAADKLAPIGMTAVQFEGQTYGVPYAVETLALFANNALTAAPEPTSIEELVAAGTEGGAENVLSLPVGEQGDAYHMQPLYSSGGGYLFGADASGNLDPKDLGVGKEGSIAAGEKIKALGEQGVLKTSISGDNAISLFTDGKAAYLVSGPWALADIAKSGLDVTMSAVPGFEGMEPAKPFAGVNAFYVASSGKNQGFAQQLLSDVASSPDIARAMFASNQLPPVSLDLQTELAADNPEMVRIAELAESTDPMPSIPAMSEIWAPLGQAQANIVGGADPSEVMTSAGEQIAGKIGA